MADFPHPHVHEFLQIEHQENSTLLRLTSLDGTNRLTSACVRTLTATLRGLRHDNRPLVIAGNREFFSVGADLNEIASLSGSEAYRFSKMGQSLMNDLAAFPASVIAAIEGHCMGGGLDLALACRRRIASPHAAFGHRGAAFGLMTGWGGTQRLPRLIGQGRALALFIEAEKVTAQRALEIGLVDELAADPVAAALGHFISRRSRA